MKNLLVSKNIKNKRKLCKQSVLQYFETFQCFTKFFPSSQVNWLAIITYKHDIYELPQELPKYLRLKISENSEISGKCLFFLEWYPSAQSPYQNESFVNTSRKLLKSRNWTFPVARHFKWKPELVSNILWVIFSAELVFILTQSWTIQTFW